MMVFSTAKQPENANEKRNSWARGKGAYKYARRAETWDLAQKAGAKPESPSFKADAAA